MKPSSYPLHAAVVACALFAAPVAVAAELSAMGMIGMTGDQVARVSLFHDAVVAGSICPSIVEIVDASGKVLATSAAVLKPGTGALFDYDLATGLKNGERLQSHVTVRTRHDHPGGANLEIHNRKTGATEVVVTSSIIPDPSLMPQ